MDKENGMSQIGMEEVLMTISEEIGKKVINRPEDYTGADGLRYCGICGKKKEDYLPDLSHATVGLQEDGTVGVIAGEIRQSDKIVFVLCDCDRKAEEEQREANELAERQAKCFSPKILPAMIQKTFANDNHEGDPKPMQKAKTYAENFSEMLNENVSLIFYGPQGTGKSYATACIANEVMKRGYSCLMTSFPEIIRQIFNVENKELYIQNLCAVDLLIIDDLFKEHRTEYAMSIVWQVIDARCILELPMVLSTNTSKEELRKYSGKPDPIEATLDSIKSRLADAWLISYQGDDRRIKKAFQKRKRLKAMFDDE